MDSPPVPKPRTLPALKEPTQVPVPLPRTKIEKSASGEKVSASEILRSIGTVSKQLSDEMADKVQKGAKSANDKLEKSILDGTRLAKDGFERTMSGSRQMRDSLTKSVVEGTRSAGMKLRSSTRRFWDQEVKQHEEVPRCQSMPAVDVSLFHNIQFHSPLLEQKKYRNDCDSDGNLVQAADILPMNLNSSTFDDLSLFSRNSDTNTDTLSNFSFDTREQDCSTSSLANESDATMYDTPKLFNKKAVRLAPEPPEPTERRNKENSMSFLRQNSLYENWNLHSDPLLQDSSPKISRVSKSTIYEFDPLKSVQFNFDGKSNELLLLETFLNGDNYGTITADQSTNYGHEDDSTYDPPTPPERFDSLPILEEHSAEADGVKREGKSQWFMADKKEEEVSSEVDVRGKPSASTSVMKRFSNILKFDTITKSGNEKVKKEDIVERPLMTQFPTVTYSGLLTRIVSGGVEDFFKNSQSRYCVLSDQKLLCYSDPTNSILKESYSLLNVYSVQILHRLPLSTSTTDNIYCFEVNVNGGGSKTASRKLLFSCNSAPERRNWAQKIVEHLSDGFPVKYSAELSRFGWCYVRDGVGAPWCGAWMMLIRRILVYYTNNDRSIKTVDLRKTLCILSQVADETTKLTCPTDGSANLLLDNPSVTLYMRFPNERELKSWRYMIKLAAHNNGAYIHHQQLTKEDVPVVVDKCINFVYVYGSMSEGIYRRAGASAAVSELLTQFRRDAWAVRLSKATHMEHDVASALKRFFRDLPEPLIPQQLHDKLLDASKLKSVDERSGVYAQLIWELPSVSRQSARKLFAHLHLIHSLRETNKMSAENLASVWAPTIMPSAVIGDSLQMAWSTKEVNVIRDLISHYPAVFKPSNIELERERTMLTVLRRVANTSAPAPQQPRSAGDLKIWVYLNEKVDGQCEHISLTPSKSSWDVCLELREKMRREPHQLMLEEVVCGGALRRVLLLEELLLDVVLRWGYWDDLDRKDNYLLLKDNQILHEMEAIRNTTSLVCGELKFANEKTKAFKLHMFEIQHSKLSSFKDKQGSSLLRDWDVKDYLWYTGFEIKRNPHTRWAITFIPKNNKQKRCKERPWFGCTIAGTVGEDQLRWLSAITFSQHTGSILPTPQLIIT